MNDAVWQVSVLNTRSIIGGSRTVIRLVHSNFFIIYPVFVMFAMWGVFIFLFLLLMVTVVLRIRKVEPPLFALCAAMIFALPSLRNSIPLQPPLGVLVDWGSFFWVSNAHSLLIHFVILYIILRLKNLYSRIIPY